MSEGITQSVVLQDVNPQAAGHIGLLGSLSRPAGRERAGGEGGGKCQKTTTQNPQATVTSLGQQVVTSILQAIASNRRHFGSAEFRTKWALKAYRSCTRNY